MQRWLQASQLGSDNAAGCLLPIRGVEKLDAVSCSGIGTAVGAAPPNGSPDPLSAGVSPYPCYETYFNRSSSAVSIFAKPSALFQVADVAVIYGAGLRTQ